jgi:hypothetical protein
MDERFHAAARVAEIDGTEIEYVIARVIPETVLMLRDVLREVARLWQESLGTDTVSRLRDDPRWIELSRPLLGLETLPPGREMVVVRVAVPSDARTRVRPQLIDTIEPDDEPPDGPLPMTTDR